MALGTGLCHAPLWPLWRPLDYLQVPNCFPLRSLPKLCPLPGTLFLLLFAVSYCRSQPKCHICREALPDHPIALFPLQHLPSLSLPSPDYCRQLPGPLWVDCFSSVSLSRLSALGGGGRRTLCHHQYWIASPLHNRLHRVGSMSLFCRRNWGTFKMPGGWDSSQNPPPGRTQENLGTVNPQRREGTCSK